MKCPMCNQDNDIVKETRSGNNHIRRRRVCLECGERFTTNEVIVRYEEIKKDLPGLYEELGRLRMIVANYKTLISQMQEVGKDC